MVSDHMKNCALSRIYVLKTALPDQHGFVKLKTIANVRLARFFFFPSLFKRRQTKPPEGFKTRVILRCAQDDSLRLNGLECDALRSKGGGNSFTFRFVQIAIQVLHPTLVNRK